MYKLGVESYSYNLIRTCYGIKKFISHWDNLYNLGLETIGVKIIYYHIIES